LDVSADSLEMDILLQDDLDSLDTTSIKDFEVIGASLKDSLESIPREQDSLLEGASQDMASQDTQAMLSGDTVGTYQEYHEGERDSLEGDMDNVLDSYPTTLTTFETVQRKEDGTEERISRRVLTRVVDPVVSHVQFTGTENEQSLMDALARGDEQQYETVDSEGNVTRTVIRRSSPDGKAIVHPKPP
jgi:hypothetical protein